MDRTVVERLVNDRRFFIENVLIIEDKQRNRVPFKLKPIQEDMLLNMTGRDVYLKPAAVGSTSLFMALFFHDCMTKPGTNSVIVAHEEFITQRLLKKVHFFINTVPPIFPSPHHKSAYEITWPELNSSFYIGTSRAYVFGRGETIHNLCCSEYAFWPDTERILGPALERIPPDGRLIIESTPNGEENDFCTLYNNAKKMKDLGAGRFTSHFYPWTLEADYRLPPDSPYALPRDMITPLELTAEEEDLVLKLGADEDQIRWRRMKMAELETLRRQGEAVRLFKQEFPEDDVSCFLVAGDMIYDADTIAEKLNKCRKAPYSHDGFKVWHKPEADFNNYLVSVDPGLAKNTRTVITVWRFWWEKDEEKAQHCATLGGMVEPAETAEKAKEIAKWYNRAMIAVEANGHGLAVLADLKDWRNLYRRKDIVSGRTIMAPGWLTTKGTKPHMIKELKRLLPFMDIHDQDIISEMRNIRSIGGDAKAVGSDDYHDSAAIAAACRQSKPISRGFVGRAGWEW